MKKIIVIMYILSFFGCNQNSSQIEYNSGSVLNDLTNSVVLITKNYSTEDKITLSSTDKMFYASGFSIITDHSISYILTNQHVCNMRDAALYTITNSLGNKYKAEFIRIDPFADICLLKTKAVIKPIKLARKNALRGDRIFIIGAPDSVYPMIVDGIVSGYYNMHMKDDKTSEEDGEFEINFRSQVTSVPIYPGSSGSPAIDINGQVVGIAFATNYEKDHISFIVPISEVHRFLNVAENVQFN